MTDKILSLGWLEIHGFAHHKSLVFGGFDSSPKTTKSSRRRSSSGDQGRAEPRTQQARGRQSTLPFVVVVVVLGNHAAVVIRENYKMERNWGRTKNRMAGGVKES